MSSNRLTLYTGMTNNLARRVYEHRNGLVEGFTKRYRIHKLVYFESFERIEHAIIREKQIKDLDRKDKIKLISSVNPGFRDLYVDIVK